MDGEHDLPPGPREGVPEKLHERLQVVGVDHIRAPGVHPARGAFAADRREHPALVMRMRGDLAADVLRPAANGVPVNQIGTPHRPEPPS